jgi:HEAT repeat protein
MKDRGMRERTERRLRKRLRQTQRTDPELVRYVVREERSGSPLVAVLWKLILEPKAGWSKRAAAARVAALADPRGTVTALLGLFRTQEEASDLWETALALKGLADTRAVPQLIRSLRDPNPDRREAAVRLLGLIRNAGPRAARALMATVTDTSQPPAVRGQAAESLLIEVLSDPDVEVRFWAVFALGCLCERPDERVATALKRMLNDDAVLPGNWWSVGREALAMLSSVRFGADKYHRLLASEIQRVLADPNSSPEDRRWAEFYDK